MGAFGAMMIEEMEKRGFVVVHSVDVVNHAPDKWWDYCVDKFSSSIDKIIKKDVTHEMLEECFPLSEKGKKVREAEINGWINGKRVSSEFPRWNPSPDSAVARSFAGGAPPGGAGGGAPPGRVGGGGPLGGVGGGSPPGIVGGGSGGVPPGGGDGDDNGHDRNVNEGLALREFFAILFEFLDSLTNLLNYLLAWRAFASEHNEGLFSLEDAFPLAFVALCAILYMVLMRHFGAFH